MQYHSDSFQFVIPAGWQALKDGTRYIFHGENGEELIVSSARILGSGTTENLEVARTMLWKNAVRAAERAAGHDDLIVTEPLERERATPQLECWTMKAETRDGKSVFVESIVKGKRALLLITFEAPNLQVEVTIYRAFLESIREITEQNL